MNSIKQSLNIDIKPTTERDLKNLQRLWADPQIMYHVGFEEGLVMDDEAMYTWYQQIHANPNTFHFSVFQNTEYVGELFYRIVDTYAQLDIKLYHRFHVGGYALSWLIQEVFKKTSCVKLYVDPSPDNHIAIHLYNSLGFIEVDPPEGYRPSQLLMELTWERFKPKQSFLETKIKLRPFRHADLPRVWELSAKEDHYAWCDLDAPYFEEYQQMSLREFIEHEAPFYLNNPRSLVILYDNVIIGRASLYWQDQRTRWMNGGFDIFDETYWSKGIGTVIMKQLIHEAFLYYEVERIGFVTWSGNLGMQRIGDKLGLKREAVIEKARYYKGVYYDSVSYGITRSQWTLRNHDFYSGVVWSMHQIPEIITELHKDFKPLTLRETEGLITVSSPKSFIGFLVYEVDEASTIIINKIETLQSVNDPIISQILIDCVEQIAIRLQISYIIIESTGIKELAGFIKVKTKQDTFLIKTMHHNKPRS
ncbi:GNAT family N-acetyltransferase [Erysipelothrix amsterdamensis]|uniref:GNAT family N-acetyltransferase n=1 Tax=Erysipelothrix amsterdamensis TaxID=2929157 RepID=A0AAU9VKY7_9FIRM|nr:GNAT family N-acetyltransferase [Erysipelothrix sp. A18Y020d]CAH2763453.1 GNAT family N-acetyltransferase [Erysipelothrix sp. A18Y020d]